MPQPERRWLVQNTPDSPAGRKLISCLVLQASLEGMRTTHISLLCLLLTLVLVPAARGQEQPAPIRQSAEGAAPDYRVRISGYFDPAELATFTTRLNSYVNFRASLEPGLPPLRVTTNPDEITHAERALARKIREARAAARQGDIFAPPLQTQIKRMLTIEVDKDTMASITDDNPGAFEFKLNGTYPKDKPVSTMPPNVLQLLPPLAEGLEYRFVGGHLILRDRRANIILDDIPYAILCGECVLDEDSAPDHKHEHERQRPRRKDAAPKP